MYSSLRDQPQVKRRTSHTDDISVRRPASWLAPMAESITGGQKRMDLESPSKPLTDREREREQLLEAARVPSIMRLDHPQPNASAKTTDDRCTRKLGRRARQVRSQRVSPWTASGYRDRLGAPGLPVHYAHGRRQEPLLSAAGRVA